MGAGGRLLDDSGSLTGPAGTIIIRLEVLADTAANGAQFVADYRKAGLELRVLQLGKYSADSFELSGRDDTTRVVPINPVGFGRYLTRRGKVKGLPFALTVTLPSPG